MLESFLVLKKYSDISLNIMGGIDAKIKFWKLIRFKPFFFSKEVTAL